MTIERLNLPGLPFRSVEAVEAECGELREGQRALLDVVLSKLKKAEPVKVEYPDYTKYNPNYTKNQTVLGGCTI